MMILMIELRLLGSLIVMAVWYIFYLIQIIRIQRQVGQNALRRRKKRNKKNQESMKKNDVIAMLERLKTEEVFSSFEIKT